MSACGCDVQGHSLRPVDQAIAELLTRVPAALPHESIALSEACGRVLALDVRAPWPMPAWDNSAMDGYALRAADVPTEGACLPLAGRIAAGDSGLQPLPVGHAVRIFTGAPLPPGADSVVAQEQAQEEGASVRLPATALGSHVRRCGEEFEVNSCVLQAGQRLRPQELGLLASLGVAEVQVYRRLRVGLLSSGNELREPGEPLQAGQICNANRYSISAVLRGWGCEVDDTVLLVDELDASRDALRLAAAQCDVLISTGGVSVGEEDHLKHAVSELGELQLWRLAIQPGKPLAFGHVCGTPWIGLPGNPAAALITALVVARPFVLRAQGCRDVLPQPLRIAAGFTWSKTNTRRQYLRARMRLMDGQLRAVLHPKQGSAMLTAACWADGLAIVECQRTLVEGELIDFLPFDSVLH
ncbi:gephyrin-like molybdotransferase Glp [Pseudomonas leptonychotis]|uniref:molybdopterin molybdotransferase MoeA n=1 Tax=Pseudomonas leptonychotis TaxID=2448482 RepID=UPI0039F1131E